MGMKFYLIIAVFLLGMLASLTTTEIIAFSVVAIILFVLKGMLSKSPDDPRMTKLKRAAEGEAIEPSELSIAYWELYNQTKRPKSEWILMSREEKSSCFKQREDLREVFNRFPTKIKTFIMAERNT